MTLCKFFNGVFKQLNVIYLLLKNVIYLLLKNKHRILLNYYKNIIIGYVIEITIEMPPFDTGQSDWLQCYVCGVRICDWQSHHTPLIEHARHQPHCPLVTTVLEDTNLNQVSIFLVNHKITSLN
jgi:hypothetical protein